MTLKDILQHHSCQIVDYSFDDTEAIDLICTLYDLYDAQRWIDSFMTRYHKKGYDDLLMKLHDIKYLLIQHIHQRMSMMDSLVEPY